MGGFLQHIFVSGIILISRWFAIRTQDGYSPQYLRAIEGSEVAQNDVVAGILAESLEYGPELLNQLHKTELEDDIRFSNETRLAAAQEKLQNRSARELDWVFEDPGQLLVGYESKKKADLSDDQLYDEAVELVHVAEEESCLLVVITDHVREPVEVGDARARLEKDGVSAQIEWLGWDVFVERVDDICRSNIKPQHEPLTRQLSRALDNEGYGSQFSELLSFESTTIEQFTHQQDQLVSLVQDLDRLAPKVGLARYADGRKEMFHYGGRKSLGALSKSYHPLAPEDIMVPFIPADYEDFPEGRGTSSGFVGVHLHLFQPTVHVGLHLRPNKNERHREVLLDADGEFAEIAERHNLTMYAMWNRWSIENIHEEPEEIQSVLSDDRLLPGEGYKHLLFGWSLSYDKLGQNFVEQIIERMESAHDIGWEQNRHLFYPSLKSE